MLGRHVLCCSAVSQINICNLRSFKQLPGVPLPAPSLKTCFCAPANPDSTQMLLSTFQCVTIAEILKEIDVKH